MVREESERTTGRASHNQLRWGRTKIPTQTPVCKRKGPYKDLWVKGTSREALWERKSRGMCGFRERENTTEGENHTKNRRIENYQGGGEY